MSKISIKVKDVKEYQQEQQTILFECCEFDDASMINEGNPFELVPKEKIPEFSVRMQELENTFICRVMGIEYSEEMDIMELSEAIQSFKKEFKLSESSFGALLKKFL